MGALRHAPMLPARRLGWSQVGHNGAQKRGRPAVRALRHALCEACLPTVLAASGPQLCMLCKLRRLLCALRRPLCKLRRLLYMSW